MRTEVPRNQLDQVICQLRFPARLSVERNIDRFQDAVRNDYPEYSQEQIVPIGVYRCHQSDFQEVHRLGGFRIQIR